MGILEDAYWDFDWNLWLPGCLLGRRYDRSLGLQFAAQIHLAISTAIVLFLAKMINLHNPYLQGMPSYMHRFISDLVCLGFWIEISSQVVNALFTVQGVGFLPWRIMDTWHIAHIVYFQRLTRKLRVNASLPAEWGDVNDIPDPLIDQEIVQVLTDNQLMKLRYRESRRHRCSLPCSNGLYTDQVKFMKSQTWYRPHASETHKAFSIRYVICTVDLRHMD